MHETFLFSICRFWFIYFSSDLYLSIASDFIFVIKWSKFDYDIVYHIVWYCIIYYDIVLYCIILYDIVSYCIILYHIVLYCIILYCIVLYYIVLFCMIFFYIVLYCIIFGCYYGHEIANLTKDCPQVSCRLRY